MEDIAQEENKEEILNGDVIEPVKLSMYHRYETFNKQYMKNYYKTHTEKYKTPIHCECGGSYYYAGKTKHLRTTKHEMGMLKKKYAALRNSLTATLEDSNL